MRIYFLQRPDKHYKNTNLRNWEEGSKPHKDSSRGAAESLWGTNRKAPTFVDASLELFLFSV